MNAMNTKTAKSHARTIEAAIGTGDRPKLYSACIAALGTNAVKVLAKLPSEAGEYLLKDLQRHLDDLGNAADSTTAPRPALSIVGSGR